MSNLSKRLETIQSVQQKLEIRKGLLVEKAMRSDNPSDILKANAIVQGIEKRESGHRKSFVIDPNQFASYMGYKDKPYNLSYNLLRKMARGSMVVNSIIKTRQDQVASFCEPQTDKYSTGFVIRKKSGYFGQSGTTETLTADDEKRIELLTEFILNCGQNDSWADDDFDTFIRKIVWDSLVYDQMNFEITTDRRGIPYNFLAVDAATMRVADSYDDEEYKEKEKIQKFGYYPSYCQIIDGRVRNEYYPWEMCFGVRNPTSNIYISPYGMSELEDLVNTVTSMLWADEYNRKFFSQGSAPKGLLKVKGGGINNSSIQEFKQQWISMVTGVMNAWRTPIIEGDIDWIDLQKSNTDMQFDKYQEFLIKISCAVYRIDPAEINFPLGGESEKKALFEGNNEARLKHSKDKGLYPLLKLIQRRINKYLINRLDPRFEFVFTGMDGVDIDAELDMDVKMVGAFMTLNEVRAKRGLKAVENGDIVLNPTYIQAINAQQQAEAMKKFGDNGQEEYSGEEGGTGDEGQEEAETAEGGEGGGDNGTEENPFEKAITKYLDTLAA